MLMVSRPFRCLLAIGVAIASSVAYADTYYVVEADQRGVTLIDLSTAKENGGARSVWSLEVRTHPYWATPSGDVAFAMHREDYTCGSDHYETPIFKEYSDGGTYRGGSSLADPNGRYSMRVIPGSGEAQLFAAICRSNVPIRKRMDELDNSKVIEAATPVLAYGYACSRLARENRADSPNAE